MINSTPVTCDRCFVFYALLGVSAQAVCKWEENLCCPDITLLPNLAKILGVTVDDFFKDVGNGD